MFSFSGEKPIGVEIDLQYFAMAALVAVAFGLETLATGGFPLGNPDTGESDDLYPVIVPIACVLYVLFAWLDAKRKTRIAVELRSDLDPE
jgi:hypothetical protein